MDLFKTLVWDLAVKAAISRLLAAWPLLTWGPLGAIVSWIATRLADRVYAELDKFVVTQAIAFRNEAHRKAFDRQVVKLKFIAPESDEFKKELENAKADLSRFVRFN